MITQDRTGSTFLVSCLDGSVFVYDTRCDEPLKKLVSTASPPFALSVSCIAYYRLVGVWMDSTSFVEEGII
jgi:hypothetical protein